MKEKKKKDEERRSQLVFDSLLNRHPVGGRKKKSLRSSDVHGPECSENGSRSIVLNLLAFRKKVLRTARQKRVAVI